jgi:hypothetical protein
MPRSNRPGQDATYPAKPPADWLMLAETAGSVMVVPLAKPDSGNPKKCRPIGCYQAAKLLADQYRKDRGAGE